ncbi:MAG TPA: hypothetical protein VFT71_02170 [Candidatus Nitrosocosmicus sp.]|nr:hypothetical protein [Candidatus Nitrosocosmicus sp.]
MVNYYIIIIAASIILLGANLNYNTIEATTMTSEASESYSCVNDTNMTSNYLTLTCSNQLTNTTNAVSDLKCDTDAGWFNGCVWLERVTNLNGTEPTQVMVTTSIDGGQSYLNETNLVTAVNSSELGIRNPNIGINQEHIYVSYEKDVGDGFYDVFLVTSDNGGETYTTPDNLSESPEDSIESVLNVDDTGKYMVSWIDISEDGSRIKSDCGKC